MIKFCRCCNKDLPLSSFSVLSNQKKKGTTYNADCKKCRQDKRKEINRRNKALAIAYKGGRCNDCLQVVHQAAFEFHHLDPSTKEKDPTHFLNDQKGLSIEAEMELDKCVLLCANCHRVRHFNF